MLQSHLSNHFKPSRTKSKFTVSSAKLEHRATALYRSKGVKLNWAKSVKDLGLDSSTGQKRTMVTLKARLGKRLCQRS